MVDYDNNQIAYISVHLPTYTIVIGNTSIITISFSAAFSSVRFNLLNEYDFNIDTPLHLCLMSFSWLL